MFETVGNIVVAVLLSLIALGLLAVPILLLYTFVKKDKETTIEQKNEALRLVKHYNIPPPPIVHCKTCGAGLDWVYTEAKPHYFGKHNPGTGNLWYIIKAKYVCPKDKSHDIGGEASNIVYWTENEYKFWQWETPFKLTLIYPYNRREDTQRTLP